MRNRLTGHRETERLFADGTSDVIVDQDFRALDDDRVDPHTKSEIAPWRGRTTFKLKPLTGQALVKAKKAAEKFQASPATTLQRDRFRLSQAKSFAKAKAKTVPKAKPVPKPALSDVPSSSQAPPAPPIVSNPGVPSRGTEVQIEPPQTIDRKHMVTTKEGEKVIMNQLRSIREFNRSMKDLIVRLFYTVDSQTGQIRTTDHWVQTPTHWIRMVHQERDDLIHPDKCPSPLSSSDALAFGDTLMANRHTCVLESSDPECNGLEIDDHWCNYTDGTGVEKAPEIDPERKLGYRWCGFSVFQIASPIETERLVPETVDIAARAPRGLRVPIEPTASERRQHELTHLPYRDWCQHCVKAKGRHAASKKQLDRQPVIQVDYCFHSTDPKLPLRKLLTAVDIVTGLGMTIVIPSKGNDDYAAAELKKFIYECGRTFGIVQYDQESSLKALCTRVCAELGGLSIRAAPKGHSQAQGSVGQMQRTFYGQLRAILYQIEESAGIEVNSDCCIYPWCVKHCQWLLNRFLVHSDGRTSYFRRWGRDYAGGLCCFGELVQAKIIGPEFTRKSDTPWSTALWLGRDTEADEIIVALPDGVRKVRTIRRFSPSLQWRAEPLLSLQALPWKPNVSEAESTDFVYSDALEELQKPRSKAPAIVPEAEAPAEAVEEANENPEVQELIEQSRGMFEQELSEQQRESIELQERPFQGTEISEPELPFSPGIRRPGDELEEPQGKSQRIDPDTEVHTSPAKVQRISSLYAVTCHVASVVNHIAGLIGVVETTLKNGVAVPVNVNMDHEELHQEIRLSEPVIWNVTREFPEEAQRIGMNHEMKSMKDFNVYTEVPIDQCSQEDIDNAIGVRWVKRWKTDIELRMRLVVQGCFQDSSSIDVDSIYASTPSLVTLRLLLVMALARSWEISLADISTAFLHAAIEEVVHVWPPAEYYPEANCLWRLNRAMYGLRQSPRLWQDHYASVMERLGFRRCKSDSNLYCHKSRSLYVLAYVDDLLIVGDAKLKKEFIEALSKELLVKITGELRPNTEHSFLGRKLRHNGDSIDILMPQKYIEDLLELYSMNKANSVNTTGSSSLKRIEDADVALDAKAHSLFRTAVGKLLWLAFVRPDCSYAVKELSRDVKGPTIESLAKLKHLLRYFAGTKGYVLRIKPTHMLSDWTSSIDIVCYVDSDWAGCSKTRKSTSGSTAQVLGCDVIHTSRAQATVALSSGDIGQGTSEALFLKSLILEAEFAKLLNITAR